MISPLRRLIATVRARVELNLLLGALVVLAGLWLFAALADEVVEGDTANLDETILLSLRNPADLSDPIGPPWFEEMMRDFTALGGTALVGLALVTACTYLGLERRWRLILLLLAVTVGSIVINSLLKSGFDRPRPDLVPRGVFVYHASFPSGHAMTAAAVYLTIGMLVARIQTRRLQAAVVMLTAILVTVLVGLSRIYLAVHWPSDVVAGWVAGAVWAAICYLASERIPRGRWTRGTRATPEPVPRLPAHADSVRAPQVQAAPSRRTKEE